MIKESILLLLCTIGLARPEPPVNQYLPPSSNGPVGGDYSPQNPNNFGQQNAPSSSYGPPSAGNQINNGGRPTDSLTNPGGRAGSGAVEPSQTYGPPNQLFAPGNQNDGQNFRNAPNGNQPPRDSYGPPNSSPANQNNNQQSLNRGSATYNGNRGGQGGTDSYQSPNGNNSPKTSYGPPATESGSPISTRGHPQSSYGTPNQSNQRGQFGSQGVNGPQTSYGAPDGFGKTSSQGVDNNQRPSGLYGSPAEGNSGQINGGAGAVGSNSYAPSGQRNNAPQDSYGPPSQNNQQGQFGGNTGLDTSFGSNRNNEQSASGYPAGSNAGSQNSEQGYSSGPSNQQNSQGYNSFGNNQQNLGGSNSPQGNSRSGSGSSNRGNEGSNEPAKYEFNYEVEDEPSGLMFGHSEKRDGDLTTGQYNVLLPDGRKQIVQYEADSKGYRPQIRYEGEANTNGRQNGRQGGTSGYNGNGQSSQGQGYPRGQSATQGGFSNAGNNPSTFGNSSPNGDYSQNGQAGYPGGAPNSNNQLSLPNNGESQGNYPNAQSPNQGGYPSNGFGAPGRSDYSGVGQNQNGEGYPRGGPSSQNQNGYESSRNENGSGYSGGAGGYSAPGGTAGFDPAGGRSDPSQGSGQFSSPTALTDNTNGYPSGVPQIPFGGNTDSSSNYPNSGKLGSDATNYQGRTSSQNPNRNGYENAQSPNETGVIGGSAGYPPRGGPSVRGSGY